LRGDFLPGDRLVARVQKTKLVFEKERLH